MKGMKTVGGTITSPESYTIGSSFPPQPTPVTLLFHRQTLREAQLSRDAFKKKKKKIYD